MNDDLMNYHILTIIFVFAISFVLSFFMAFALPHPASATSQGFAVDGEESVSYTHLTLPTKA